MELETKRLIIRYFQSKDLNDLHEILSDDETMYYSEKPFSLPKTKEFLETFCIKKEAAFAVKHKSDDKVIGYLLFKEIEDKVYEIGWFFNRNYWRKGFAFEACERVIKYGFDKLQLQKIVAETIDTVKTIALMEKLGMSFEGKKENATQNKEGKDTDIYVYAIKRTNFN